MTSTDETPLDLDAIRARADAASPGPWTVEHGSIVHAGPSESRTNERWGTFVVASVGAHDISRPGPANTAFIAHARADVPALIAEIERLESPFAGPNWMAGGRWEVEYWREGAGVSFPASHEPSPEANRKRYVWRGPDEPFDFAEHARDEAEWERDEAAATMQAEDDDEPAS